MMDRRTVAGIAALIWMCVIFAFSAQKQEESSAVSEAFSYRMVSSAGTFFRWNLDEEEMHRIASAIENTVRKAAHMTEFAILAVFYYLWLGKWQSQMVKRGLSAWALAALYAASDETHQLFVPGRAGRFRDVMIDSAGAFLGIFIFIGVKKCISFLWSRRRYREQGSS